jgi:predicted phage terminase large subunit-like protein
MIEHVTQTEIKRNAEKIRASLKVLCKVLLGYADWSANPKLHDAIYEHLKRPSKFKLILIPRDHLKSSIITKGGAIWRMLNNSSIRILIANNTWDNARKFLDSIRSYLAPGLPLSIYFGHFQTDRWNRDEIIIKQRRKILDAPTIATTGLEKEQTSQHYDLIIGDDLVARENVTTPEQRQKVKDYINSLMALLEPAGELWIVGTRWSQDDAYGDLLEEGLWDVLQCGAYMDETRSSVLFPEKFTIEKLAFLRKKLGPVLFSCWYMNDPINPEAADFKREWIKEYDANTAHPANLYLTIDPAVSLGRDADFTGMVVAGQYSDRRIRVVECVRSRMVPNDLVDKVFELVKRWRLHRVGIETFAFQRTLKYEIQRQQRERGIFFSIDELGKNRSGRGEPVLSKEARIRRLQPYFEQRLVEIRSDMQDMVDELLAFPRGKHDDLIDALSYQLDYLYPSPAPLAAEEPEVVHVIPPTMKSVLRGVWNKQGTGLLDRYFNDLKAQAQEPLMR